MNIFHVISGCFLYVTKNFFIIWLAGWLVVEFVEHKKPMKYTQINFLISLRLVLQIEKQNTRNYMWLDVVHTVYSLSINNLGGKLE